MLAGVAQMTLGQTASPSDVDATTNATAVEAAQEAAKAAAALLASMPECGVSIRRGSVQNHADGLLYREPASSQALRLRPAT